MRRFALCTLAAASLAACDTVGAGPTPYAGVLYQNDPYTETITAPDTVVAGQPFVAVVRTSGGGCERQGDTMARVSGRVAEITPTDLTIADSNTACTAILQVFQHRAEVAFAEPGPATIRAVGASEFALPGSAVVVERVEVERPVVVLPAR